MGRRNQLSVYPIRSCPQWVCCRSCIRYWGCKCNIRAGFPMQPTVRIRNIKSRYPSALRAISFRLSARFVPSLIVPQVMLTPISVLAGVLGVWRLAADPGWTSGFFIADGLLSRYQFWFAIAIAAQTFALLVNRRRGLARPPLLLQERSDRPRSLDHISLPGQSLTRFNSGPQPLGERVGSTAQDVGVVRAIANA
jgi:hypothetical protein